MITARSNTARVELVAAGEPLEDRHRIVADFEDLSIVAAAPS